MIKKLLQILDIYTLWNRSDYQRNRLIPECYGHYGISQTISVTVWFQNVMSVLMTRRFPSNCPHSLNIHLLQCQVTFFFICYTLVSTWSLLPALIIWRATITSYGMTSRKHVFDRSALLADTDKIPKLALHDITNGCSGIANPYFSKVGGLGPQVQQVKLSHWLIDGSL